MPEFVPKEFFHRIKRIDRLKEFFTSSEIAGFPEIMGTTKRKEVVDRLSSFYESIPKEKKRLIEKALATVNQLSTDRGISALNEVIELNQYEISTDDYIEDGLHDRSLYYYMERPEIFNDAVTISGFRDITGWTRYPVPEKSFSFIKSQLGTLQITFEDIFRKETRGQYCSIDERVVQDVLYITISFEDYPRVCSQIRNNEVDHLAIFRELNAIYFIYLPDEKEVHIKYHGKWEKKDEYLRAFLKVVFDIEMKEMKRTYNLNCLLDKNFEMNTDEFPDDIESWFLRSLKLRYPFSKKRITLSMPPRDTTGTGSRGIWEMIDTLNLAIPLQRGGLVIDEADFSLRFRSPESKGGIKTVPFHVNWTNKCDLGMIDEFERKASKILQKSGIDVGFTS